MTNAGRVIKIGGGRVWVIFKEGDAMRYRTRDVRFHGLGHSVVRFYSGQVIDSRIFRRI